MVVELTAPNRADQIVIQNLYPLYLHDLSEFGELDVDQEGQFVCESDLDVWWEKEVLHPMVIRANGLIAGFVLVCGAPYVNRGRDFRLNEFFVLRRFRRRGVGQAAAVAAFNRFPGAWELGWLPNNLPAAGFWKKTVANYTSGCFQEALIMQSPEDGMPGLHFSNW